MLNIVVPMAGAGARFAKAGFQAPKPLILVHGSPMAERVIRNITPTRPHRFIFLVLQDHLDRHNLASKLNSWAPGCEVIAVNTTTEGAACTVLLARNVIDAQEPLMIANCDQWIDASIDDFLAFFDKRGLDGLIMTMKASETKWSYARCNAIGEVVDVAEKRVISDEATVGIYLYRSGADFVRAADQMIQKNIRTNGEFYVAPVYNELLQGGKKVECFNIGRAGAGMYGLGTPEDLQQFVEDPRSLELLGKC